MENKKHIFATHISEIGKKNPQLEQDLNVINEMEDGGYVYDFKVGDKGTFSQKAGFLYITIKSVTPKTVSFITDDGVKKSVAIDFFNNKFDKYKDDITATSTTSDTNIGSNEELEVGKRYEVKNYYFSDKDIADSFIGKPLFEVYGKDSYEYKIEEPFYNDDNFWRVKKNSIYKKEKPIFDKNETVQLANYDINFNNLSTASNFKDFLYELGNDKYFTIYDILENIGFYIVNLNSVFYYIPFNALTPKKQITPSGGFLNVGAVYKIEDFTFIGEAERVIKEYQNWYPKEDEFKVFSIMNQVPKLYAIETPSYMLSDYFYLKANEVKFNFNTLFEDETTSSTNNDINIQKPKYPTIASLKRGKTYDSNNFDFVAEEGLSFKSFLKDNNTDKFEVYNISSRNKKYNISLPKTLPLEYFDLEFKCVLELKNELEIGDKIRVADYVFFNYTANFNLIARKVQQVEIVDIEDNENYVFQDDNGNKYYVYLSGLLLAPNPRLENGQILDFSKYQIINNATSKNIRQDNLTEGKIYTPETAPYLVIESTGAVIDLEKKSIAEISAFPKFEYQIGDEIEIDKIDISQGRITEINLMRSLGYKYYKVVGFLPIEDANGYFYEVVVGNSTPYHYNKIPTNKVEPKTQPIIQPTIEPTSTLEDLNLQPATQNLPKPPPEKVNIQMATQNFIQQNIIGENIFFTPKFVLLESLMELNELSKDKEGDLTNDLESIINDIDSFVIDQCAITPNDNSCGQVPQNIQSTPTTKSKSKKSKPMPNMDVNSIMNNPNLPDDIRNMIERGLESGMNTINV